MHLLSTIHPTQNQLRVLAKIIVSKDKPTIAAAKISADANLVAARNLLAKLNLITFTDNNATLTDKGIKVAQDQDIADESGQITDTGAKLAAENSDGKPDQGMPSSEAGATLPNEPPMSGMGDLPSLGMESFSPLFKTIINS